MSAFGGKADIAAKLLTRDEARRISPCSRRWCGSKLPAVLGTTLPFGVKFVEMLLR